jgi:hypothetical protein
MGCIRVSYSFNLVFQDSSLSQKSLIYATYVQFAVIILDFLVFEECNIKCCICYLIFEHAVMYSRVGVVLQK